MHNYPMYVSKCSNDRGAESVPKLEGQEHLFISFLSMQRHRANVKISPKPKVGGAAAPLSPRQRCSFVFSCVGLSPHNLGQSPHNLSEKHGSRAEFPIQLVGRLPHQLSVLPHQLCALPHQIVSDWIVFWLKN